MSFDKDTIMARGLQRVKKMTSKDPVQARVVRTWFGSKQMEIPKLTFLQHNSFRSHMCDRPILNEEMKQNKTNWFKLMKQIGNRTYGTVFFGRNKDTEVVFLAFVRRTLLNKKHFSKINYFLLLYHLYFFTSVWMNMDTTLTWVLWCKRIRLINPLSNVLFVWRH